MEIVEVVASEPKKHGAEAKKQGAEALARLHEAIANQKELREKTFRVKNRRTGAASIYPGWWVVSAEAELETLIARRGETSWRASIVKFFHRHPVQVFFIVLLVLDVVIVFVELFIDAEFPRCALVIRDATSCCPASAASDHGSSSDGHAHLRFLASGSSADGSSSGSGDGHHALCSPDYSVGAAADCDSHQVRPSYLFSYLLPLTSSFSSYLLTSSFLPLTSYLYPLPPDF